MGQKSLFLVSLIIQDEENSQPWLCSNITEFLNIEEAHKEIQSMRERHRVLSAWINMYENEEKKIVFHECYINVLGYIRK